MAAKPYHSGHDGLVRIAAKENDQVMLFVSTGNRDTISGEGMLTAWKELIEPKLPGNVTVTYGGSPVGHVFKVVGDANQEGSTDTFTIYSDPVDLETNFKTLPKYADKLLANGQVKMRPVERTSTVDISGTQMRQWFEQGDQEQFLKHVPRGVNGVRYWNILNATKLAKPEPKGTKKAKPKVEKKPVQGETLLRRYVREVLGR